jgi:sulfate adenylyltransferase subunit 1 (EFTu-like GTPase family)
MTDAPLRAGARYAIKHATHAARVVVDEVVDHVDVHTLAPDPNASSLGLNDIGRVRLRASKPMAFDAYARNRATGSFILIDESTNDTVGAGMIR